ncbi:MAG: tRNA (adenosine(37)-N6)-dimethylallyltransferase MiaA [Alphaproteobacteria bacterium]|nr:MAG: tRNA (adenosine(37)-N6)-dimethylallyltransferase MiaA [Alphaproteobacteria bacterium]
MIETEQHTDRRPGTILLAGPTASGKSATAIAIAEEFGGVIINADSMQIYDGLRVLTARPDETEEARVPHRLYGTLDPSVRCTAAHWRDLALAEIAKVQAEGKLPVVVGGTGLYFDILTKGIAEIPSIGEELRARLRHQQEVEGTAAIHERLSELDPDMAARLKPGDTQRLLRALEVIEETGVSLLHWQRKAPAGPILEGPRLWLALMPERQWLYDRCNRRLDWMVTDGGALEEVRGLMDRHLDPTLPAMKALGVPELIEVLDGTLKLEEALDRIKMLTRRYAKRQMTWVRNKMCEANSSSAQDLESLKAEFFPFIRRFLLTQGN